RRAPASWVFHESELLDLSFSCRFLCPWRGALIRMRKEGRRMLEIAFWILTAIVLVSAIFVIAARNPVHSVLWLILAFFTSAGLLVLIGAEFLAMLLVVVYVGAVAVLFLFVVMMLDIDFVELKQGFLSYLPAGLLVALALLGEIGVVA